MKFDRDNVLEIVLRLNEKSKELDEIYTEINKKCELLNGNSDNWKGKGQEKFSNNYVTISNKYYDISNGFNDCLNFLLDVVETYDDIENSTLKDVDNEV